MLRVALKSACVCGLAGLVLSAAAQTATKPAARPVMLRESAAKAGFTFLPNAGQADPADLFVAHGSGFSIGLEHGAFAVRSFAKKDAKATVAAASEGGLSTGLPKPVAMDVRSARLEFVGANPDARVEGLNPTAAKVNYLEGNDPSQWKTNLTGFSRVKYSGLYPGIDLIYYGERERHLEYDLVVAPGADPHQVRLKVASEQGAAIDARGNLCFDGVGGRISLMAPEIYQDDAGGKREIAGSFVQVAKNEFGFKLAAYDHTRPLVIDPKISLLYATYAGGIHNDEAFDLTLDASGNTYLTGWSASQDFPVSGNALQQVRQNIGYYVYDVVVMKFDSSGNLLFSTFLGGAQNDQGNGIRVDQSGLVFVSGSTASSDFPVTANAYQAKSGGNNDAFFSVLSNDGSQLIYSTYLGGSGDENVYRLIQGANDSFWIGGGASAAGLPATAGAFQSVPKGVDTSFVANLVYNPANATTPLTIPALTFIGGSTGSQESAFNDLALDATGNLYATGATVSTDFPTTANAYQKGSAFTLSGGCYNSQYPNTIQTVVEFSADLKTLIYGSMLGGKTEDQNGYPVCNQTGRSIHPDGKGNIWILGTVGMQDFPTTSNALSTKLNGNGYAGVDVSLAELTPGATSTTLTYGTYLGGSQFDYGGRAVWDASGNIWITATSASTDFPGMVTGTSLQPANAGGYDTTITELQPDGTKILYATYLGGSGDEDANSGRGTIALDAANNIYLTGGTGSGNYPVSKSAVQASFANGDSGPDGYDIYYAVLGAGTIGNITPTVSGNGGDTTVTIQGAGFVSGATCQLVQGTTVINAAVATVNAGGTAVGCSFALNGATAGTYDIVVTNPSGGGTLTRAGAFKIQSGGAPNLSAQVIGRAAIRIGTPTTFHITVTNSGTQDAYAVPLWVSMPSTIPFTVNGLTSAQMALNTTTLSGTSYFLLLIPDVAAGETLTYPLQITAPVGGSSAAIPITASIQASWFGSLSDLNAAGTATTYSPTCVTGSNPAYQNCEGAYISIMSAGLVATSNSTGSLAANPHGNVGDLCNTALGTADAFNKGKADGTKDAQMGGGSTPNYNPPEINPGNVFNYWAYNSGYLSGFLNVVSTVAGGGHVTLPIAIGGMSPALVGNLLRSESLNNMAYNDQAPLTSLVQAHDGASCPLNPPPSPPASIQPVSPIKPMPVGAIDPNDKGGSTGDGSTSHFLNARSPLPYNVAFENEAKATAPASQVIVMDQLDPTKVDLTTVTLGAISFGTNVIPLPGGLTNYNTLYKLSASLYVRIQGSLDTQTGMLKWTFTSIDPKTGLPPTDPTVGFLPPDTDGIVGQGSVIFNALPKAGQTTGTAISNTAKVFFDANAAINTPTWTNMLDVDAPVSKVTALPTSVKSVGATTPITVAWSGTDKGSGILFYNIYVSDNGAAYTQWLSQVSTTTAVYAGQTNHTYGFYSISTDGAGNVEATKAVADTSTTVSATASTSTLTASATSITPGQSLTLSVTVAGTGGGSLLPTGTVTFVSGSTTLGTATLNASGVGTLTTSSLAAGAYTIVANYGGDSNFGFSTSNSVLVTVALLPTTTTLATSAAVANPGVAVTFTASISAASGSPTGTVKFLSGTTTLGTGTVTAGKATFTTSSLALGSYSISAQYSGDMTFATSTSSALTELIANPSYTLAVSPTSLSFAAGQSGTATFTVTPVAGFNQAVSFSCLGLPTYSKCTFAPASVTPSGAAATTTLTIATNVVTAAAREPSRPGSDSKNRGILAAFVFLGLGGAYRLRRNRVAWPALFGVVLLGLLTALGGCASNGFNTTPKGTSTVTVTATGGSLNQTASLTVTIQ